MALLLNPFLEECNTFDLNPMLLRSNWSPLGPRRRHPNVKCFNPLAYTLFQEDKCPNLHTNVQDNDFKTMVDLRGYNPSQVKVEADPQTKIVSVKGSRMVGNCKQHFQRSFKLPEICQVQQLKGKFMGNGFLLLSAPINKSVEQKESQEDQVKKIQLGKEVVEVEDIPEPEDPKSETLSNPGSVLEQKNEQLENADEVEKCEHCPPKEVPNEVLEVPIEVEQEVEPQKEVAGPFELKMDITGFSPKDIEVQMMTDKDVLSVKAIKRVEEDGGFLFSQINKDVALDGKLFDLNKLSCSVEGAENQTLVITAPRLALDNGIKNIPIKFNH